MSTSSALSTLSAFPDTIARGPAAQRALAYWTKRRGAVPLPSSVRDALTPSLRTAPRPPTAITPLRRGPALGLAIGDAVSFEHETDIGTLEYHDGIITATDTLTGRYCVQSITERSLCRYLPARRLSHAFGDTPAATPSAFPRGTGVWFSGITKPGTAEWLRGEIIIFNPRTRKYHINLVDSHRPNGGVFKYPYEVLPRYAGELAPGVPGPGRGA